MSISETYTCKICHNPYNENEHAPMSLICGHTFCFTCLKKNSTNQRDKNRTKCMFRCELVTDLRYDELSKNFEIFEKITSHQNNQNLKLDADNLYCASQNHQQHIHATFLCLDCEQFLCTGCKSKHSHYQRIENVKVKNMLTPHKVKSNSKSNISPVRGVILRSHAKLQEDVPIEGRQDTNNKDKKGFIEVKSFLRQKNQSISGIMKDFNLGISENERMLQCFKEVKNHLLSTIKRKQDETQHQYEEVSKFLKEVCSKQEDFIKKHFSQFEKFLSEKEQLLKDQIYDTDIRKTDVAIHLKHLISQVHQNSITSQDFEQEIEEIKRENAQLQQEHIDFQMIDALKNKYKDVLDKSTKGLNAVWIKSKESLQQSLNYISNESQCIPALNNSITTAVEKSISQQRRAVLKEKQQKKEKEIAQKQIKKPKPSVKKRDQKFLDKIPAVECQQNAVQRTPPNRSKKELANTSLGDQDLVSLLLEFDSPQTGSQNHQSPETSNRRKRRRKQDPLLKIESNKQKGRAKRKLASNERAEKKKVEEEKVPPTRLQDYEEEKIQPLNNLILEDSTFQTPLPSDRGGLRTWNQTQFEKEFQDISDIVPQPYKKKASPPFQMGNEKGTPAFDSLFQVPSTQVETNFPQSPLSQKLNSVSNLAQRITYSRPYMNSSNEKIFKKSHSKVQGYSQQTSNEVSQIQERTPPMQRQAHSQTTSRVSQMLYENSPTPTSTKFAFLQYENKALIYDPNLNEWSQLQYIRILGDFESQNNCQSVLTTNSAWTKFSWESNALLVTGGVASRNVLMVQYVPETNQILVEKLPHQMKSIRQSHSMVCYKNVFFVLGGLNSSHQTMKDCEMMEVVPNGSNKDSLKEAVWVEMPKMLQCRHSFGSVVSQLSKSIIVFGSGGSFGAGSMEIYDIREKLWKLLYMKPNVPGSIGDYSQYYAIPYCTQGVTEEFLIFCVPKDINMNSFSKKKGFETEIKKFTMKPISQGQYSLTKVGQLLERRSLKGNIYCEEGSKIFIFGGNNNFNGEVIDFQSVPATVGLIKDYKDLSQNLLTQLPSFEITTERA